MSIHSLALASASAQATAMYFLTEGDDVFIPPWNSQTVFTIYGQGGNDVFGGGAKGDHLYGDSGNDTIWGNAGDDTIDGGSGSDALFGDQGRDTLRGGSEADRLYGSIGDTLTGGSEGDRFVFTQVDGDQGKMKVTDFSISQGDQLDFVSLGWWASDGSYVPPKASDFSIHRNNLEVKHFDHTIVVTGVGKELVAANDGHVKGAVEHAINTGAINIYAWWGGGEVGSVPADLSAEAHTDGVWII